MLTPEQKDQAFDCHNFFEELDMLLTQMIVTAAWVLKLPECFETSVLKDRFEHRLNDMKYAVNRIDEIMREDSDTEEAESEFKASMERVFSKADSIQILSRAELADVLQKATERLKDKRAKTSQPPEDQIHIPVDPAIDIIGCKASGMYYDTGKQNFYGFRNAYANPEDPVLYSIITHKGASWTFTTNTDTPLVQKELKRFFHIHGDSIKTLKVYHAFKT